MIDKIKDNKLTILMIIIAIIFYILMIPNVDD